MNYINTISRNVIQTLWYAIMEDKYQGENEFENDAFMVRPYNWNEDDEEGSNSYHFHHKPSGLKIYWYKYPMRSFQCNMDVDADKAYAVFTDCMNSIHPKVRTETFEYWWKENNDGAENC